MANLGLRGWWRLDETTGDRAADSSGNNLHGQLGSTSGASGSPTWITDGPRHAGRLAGGLRFGAGFDGFVEVTATNPAILEPCVVSVEAWIRSSSSLGGSCYVLSKGAEACSFASYALYGGRESPGGLYFYTCPTAGEELSPFAPHDAVWNGKWHHVVGTFDGRIVRLYVDGIQQGSGRPVRAASFIRYNLSTNNRFYLGMYRMMASGPTCNLGFEGDLSDVRVWAGVLSPDEVVARYNALDLP